MKLRTRSDNKKRILIMIAIAVAVVALIGIIIGVVSLISGSGANSGKYDDPYSITRIHVMIKPKTTYFVGEEFDPTGIIVHVITQDPDKSYTVDDPAKLTFEGFDSSEAKESLGVGVWYKGVKTEYVVEIKEFVSEAPVPTSIEVKDMFVEYSVYEWQNWGPSELNAWILITYSDGTTRGSLEETPLQRSYITGWDPEYNYSAGKTQVTVSYTENGVTYKTTVEITLN